MSGSPQSPDQVSADRIEERVRFLTEAQKAYYETGEPLIGDAVFDELEEELRRWDPENLYFRRVGAAPEERGRVEIQKQLHQVPMLSMDKAKSAAEVEAWWRRLRVAPGLDGSELELCVEPKVDGVSASCFYRAGKLEYVATRGDGRQGQNVSHIADYLEDIPKQIDFSGAENRAELLDRFEVRGEIYLPQDTALERRDRPLRNICSGLVLRKEKLEDLGRLRFAAYQCPLTRLSDSESEQVSRLARLGFHTVEAHRSRIDGLEAYYEQYLSVFRRSWPYETDGLIVTIEDSRLFERIDSLWVVDHHHHYAIALKPQAEGGKTQLRRVIWQVTRRGKLSPVAEFEPLRLAGAMVERASLHNLEIFQKLRPQPGDWLFVERSGDVIPYVTANLSLSEEAVRDPEALSWPSACSACGGPLEQRSVDLFCGNPGCSEQIIQRILFWVRQADMQQIAEQSIRQLYDLGKLRSIEDLYRLRPEDFDGIPGYAEKKRNNFLEQLERSRRLSMPELLVRLGIPFVQQKNVRKLAELRRKSRLERFLAGLAEAEPNSSASLFSVSDSERIFSALTAVLRPEFTEAEIARIAADLEAEFPALAPGLADKWGTAAFRVQVFREDFALWQAVLLRQKPGCLEISGWEDLIRFSEPGTRYTVLNSLAEWLNRHGSLLEHLRGELELLEERPVSPSAGASELSVCLTGSGPMPRRQLEAELGRRGYRAVSSVRPGISMLLCSDLSSSSKKLQRARELGVPIVLYTDFFAE